MGEIAGDVFGKSSDPPPAPDYVGAANAQGQANLESAIATATLSNPNIVSPEGTRTVTYTKDPVTGSFVPTVTQKYSPAQQAIYDRNLTSQRMLADLGITATQLGQNVLRTPLDFGNLPAMPGDASATRDAVINAAMSRVGEDIGRRRDQANSDLIAQGIRPGTKAYADQMALIDRSETDARNQAILAAGQEAQRDFSMDTDRRRQAITELLAKRQTPLNEISAIRSGSQIAPLQFQNYTGATVAPAPIFAGAQAQGNAAWDAYNAEQSSNNAMMSGLFSLGSAAIGAPTGSFSWLGGF